MAVDIKNGVPELLDAQDSVLDGPEFIVDGLVCGLVSILGRLFWGFLWLMILKLCEQRLGCRGGNGDVLTRLLLPQMVWLSGLELICIACKLVGFRSGLLGALGPIIVDVVELWLALSRGTPRVLGSVALLVLDRILDGSVVCSL